MRLIDADSLKVDTVYANSLIHANTVYVYTYSEKAIEEAPTVKAIPIEWIKNYIEENYYYDSDIGRMIEDWEKENEID